MQNAMFFSILSFFYCCMTCLMFFLKAKIKNKENHLYGILLIVNIIGLIIELTVGFMSRSPSFTPNILYFALSKALLFYFVVWVAIFFSYICIVSVNNDKTRLKLNYMSTFILLVSIVVITILPVNYHAENNVVYSYGMAVTATYILSGIFIFLCSVLLFFNIKNIFQKKYTPLLLFLGLGIVTVGIQVKFPELTLMLSLHTFITCIMYHTIENPDIRIIEYEKKEKELAMSASEAKTAFLSSMSHELRTPLNAIVGLSEDMLSFKEQVPNEVKEDCEDIVNASNTLLEIIGNILDISKIEGGKLELIETDYLPKEEIESLLKIMRTKVEEKDLEFNVYIDPNIPECLYGDRLRIKQIINNFLSNAIKYTEKGSINFGARWINDSLEIRVKDTGRGIKKEDMNKLFEKFERLHVEKTSAVQGTGLGLAITKNLVDLMGGTVRVDSEEGEGSMFSVVIPQKLGNKDNIVREALSVEERKVIDFTGKKLLVVDDNKLNIKVLRKAISSFNFEIDECYDGKTAIDKIGVGNYDLILMDIMMPIMGGEEAMGILKQNPNFNTPVIALTADATTGAKERYLSCGFVDYLAKPFSRDIIAQKLEKILGNTK